MIFLYILKHKLTYKYLENVIKFIEFYVFVVFDFLGALSLASPS